MVYVVKFTISVGTFKMKKNWMRGNICEIALKIRDLKEGFEYIVHFSYVILYNEKIFCIYSK